MNTVKNYVKTKTAEIPFFIFSFFLLLAFSFFLFFPLISRLILCLKKDSSFVLLVLKWLPLKSQITLSDWIFKRCLRLFSLPSQFYVDTGHQNGRLFMTFSGDYLYFMLFVVVSYYLMDKINKLAKGINIFYMQYLL